MSSSPLARARAHPRRLAVTAMLAVTVVASSACVMPSIPAYPYWGPYGSRQGVINKAQDISNKLEQFVKDFLDGKNNGVIPANLLPDGRQVRENTSYTVIRPSQIDPAKQWTIRRAHPVNWDAEPGLFPDVNATYLYGPAAVVPFGSKAIVTGQFPRSRFFDVKALPSFQPEQYHYEGFGVGEVPIVDADINPDPGSTNPFRVGANRNATNRNYTVTFESKVANAAVDDPAYKPPFRAAGNSRLMGGLRYQGPWDDPASTDPSPLVYKRGLWGTGELWIRYYAPDKSAGALGGVAIPKVVYQLPDGRQYYIQADLTNFSAGVNATEPVARTSGSAPSGYSGSGEGWQKLWGVLRFGFENVQKATGSPDYSYIRRADKAGNGRGEDLAAPQNYEGSQSLCTYCTYFIRSMSRQSGKVVVLTGRLPTTPKTRNGEATMTGAQLRYWSVTSYDGTDALDGGSAFGKPTMSLMDDEVVTDANGYYTIVLSSAADRPANATAANGVTWKDWGPTGDVSMYVRFMSVGPEWTFAKAPDETRLGRGSDHASVNYNRNLIGNNNRAGWMGEYQPVVSYLSKTAFQNLGTNVRWNQVPVGSGW